MAAHRQTLKQFADAARRKLNALYLERQLHKGRKTLAYMGREYVIEALQEMLHDRAALKEARDYAHRR